MVVWLRSYTINKRKTLNQATVVGDRLFLAFSILSLCVPCIPGTLLYAHEVEITAALLA
jgi:hypothetical protein